METRQTRPRGGMRELIARELAAAREAEKRTRSSEALSHYGKALELSRSDARVLGETIRQVLQAAQRDPRSAALRHLLGAAYFFARDTRNAESQLKKAVALSPKAAPILCLLGDSLVHNGKPEEALAAFSKAVSVAPEDRSARLKLAGLLAILGKKDEARALYRGLIDEGTQEPLAYAGLIEVSDYVAGMPDPPEYSAVAALAGNTDLPPALRRMLHFSAAKIDRQRGRREHEFAHYLRAKEYFPQRFDLQYFSELVAALSEAVDAAFFAERAAWSDKSRRPVFIFGMPRSGTTLTEQILAAHPNVAAAGELTFFSEAARQLGLLPRRSAESIPLERMSERIRAIEPREIKAIAAKYSEEIQWRGGGRMRVTDKMPGNFLHLWLIALVFREAAYIHCVRDPLATCVSCFTTDLGDAHSYTRDLETLAGYYRVYADLMRHWEKTLPVAIFENRYEDLVRDPESSVRALLETAGLPFDPACLSFHESHRLARTASYAAVREPIHPRSLEKWREYEPYLEPLRAALDAPREKGPAPD